MVKRVVGRRLVDESTPRTATLVVVTRRWFWQREEFYSEGTKLEVSISPGGVLTVVTEDQDRTYNPHHWKTVTSRTIPSRSRV